MPCAVDHNLLLDIVLTHRFHRTVLRGRRVRALGEIGTVLRVNGILVAGRNANWMDPHERSVPDEVRIQY